MKNPQNDSHVSGGSKFELTEEEKHDSIQWSEANWPTSSGKTQYLRFLRGEKLSYRQTLLAKCAECCGGYVDGKCDCRVVNCPAYPYMPNKGKTEGVANRTTFLHKLLRFNMPSRCEGHKKGSNLLEDQN